MLSTKISGLAVDTEYSFHLVLRTTGGTYSSPVLKCRTHKMTDLSGISVTPGILPEQILAALESAVDRIGARIADAVRIDTTHFVCTEGRGKDWERAKEMNIPVVRPEWVEGCEREGRIVGVRGYYLDANPKQRQVGSNPSISNAAVQMSNAAAASSVTIGAKGSQANLPERSAPTSPPPKSPDKGSHITGEGNGPAQGAPPTPPPKNETPMSAVSAEASSASPAAGSSVSEEEKEDEDAGEESEGAPSPVRESAPQKEAKRSEASMKAKVEDEMEGDDSGHGDMDEVPL